MEKNQIVELYIEDMSDEGLGIGHTEGGMAVFVKDTVVGDRVRARIVKTKKTYAFGRLEQVLTPSPDRVAPVCPAARSCGGCQIQEMSYEAQLRLKENKVRNNLQRIGGIRCEDAGTGVSGQGTYPQTAADMQVRPQTTACPQAAVESQTMQQTAADLQADQQSSALLYHVLGMTSPYYYRNKSEYPVGRDKSGKLIAGFYAGRTHSVIDGSRCVIGIEENRYILDAVLSWMERYHIPEYKEETGKGLIRNIMIRCGFATGQIMTVIVANSDRLPHEADLVLMLQRALPRSGAGREIAGIILNTNTARTNVILGRKNRTLWGSDIIEDSVGDVRYQISPLSFYQVNPVQTKKLYETALSFARLTGKETVLDLYCGIGTISLFLARKAKVVCGVEVVPDAIANAKENAKLNHIDNVRFICGKAEEVLPREYREHQIRADIIVVDPPRKGLDETVIDTIASMTPDRVVYVSCNSSTLARDLALFAEKGYQTKKVQPVDMFPHSVHIETVCLLTHS